MTNLTSKASVSLLPGQTCGNLLILNQMLLIYLINGNHVIGQQLCLETVLEVVM